MFHPTNTNVSSWFPIFSSIELNLQLSLLHYLLMPFSAILLPQAFLWDLSTVSPFFRSFRNFWHYKHSSRAREYFLCEHCFYTSSCTSPTAHWAYFWSILVHNAIETHKYFYSNSLGKQHVSCFFSSCSFWSFCVWSPPSGIF